MVKFDHAMELKLKRSFSAPVSRLFRAWADAEVLKMWWHAGSEYKSSVVEVDFRVDGLYRLGMIHIEKQVEHIVGGKFMEIIPDKKIVFTWKWEGHDEINSSIITVDFFETADGSELILTQTGFSGEDSRKDHNTGWDLCLDELVNLLTPIE
jgi:uncharacterized protein YndB with AHSA1/START domain